MANPAIGRGSILLKLFFMVIAVAVGTICMFYRVGVIPHVAFLTFHYLMLPFEGVIGFIVVKAGQALYLTERFNSMAVGTIAPKLIFMNISMAVCTT